jgi:hypothetical protein
VPLDWCSATLPVGNEFISIKWHKQGNKVEYQADIPAGYTVTVEPVAGIEAVRK